MNKKDSSKLKKTLKTTKVISKPKTGDSKKNKKIITGVVAGVTVGATAAVIGTKLAYNIYENKIINETVNKIKLQEEKDSKFTFF